MTDAPTPGSDLATRPLALVTGASSGIGRALAGQFADHDWDLVLAADEDLTEVQRELATRGAKVHAVNVDLMQPEDVTALHQQVQALGRPLAAAALNAGVANGGAFVDSDLEADLRLVDLNCRSTLHLAKLVVRDMVAAGDGLVLFTSSIAALAPGPWHASYAASKAFVHSLAEALHHELADTGVGVTSLLPGPTETEIFDRGEMRGTRIAEGSKADPDDVAREAYDALVARKDKVVTGSAAVKLQAAGGPLLPDQVAAAAAGRQTEPGGAE